jgi:hypothetical protein
MVSHEVLHVTRIVEQFLCAQHVEERVDDARIVALFEEFSAQIAGGVIAAGQGVEGRDTRPTRV